MGRLHLGFSESAFRAAVGEGISDALLSVGNVFAAKDVKEFDAFQIGRLDLFDKSEDGIVRGVFSDEHGDIAADGGKWRQSLEGFRGGTAREDQIEIQLGEKDGIAQILLAGDAGRDLTKSSEGILAEVDRGRLEKERAGLGFGGPGHSPQTVLLEKFLEGAFQVENIETGVTVCAGPEERRFAADQGNSETAFFGWFAIYLGEDTANFEEREVAVLTVGIAAKGVEQTGEQARAQDVHVATEGITQRDWSIARSEGRCLVGDQGLPLGFGQAKGGENPARLGNLVPG